MNGEYVERSTTIYTYNGSWKKSGLEAFRHLSKNPPKKFKYLWGLKKEKTEKGNYSKIKAKIQALGFLV